MRPRSSELLFLSVAMIVALAGAALALAARPARPPAPDSGQAAQDSGAATGAAMGNAAAGDASLASGEDASRIPETPPPGQAAAHEHMHHVAPDAEPGADSSMRMPPMNADSPDMSPEDPGAAPPQLPETNDLIRVVVREEDREAEVIIGPVALTAGGPHLRPEVQLAGLPLDGWLHGFSWEMRDREGGALPPRLLHHVNVIDPDNRELFSAVPRRIIAAGRETSGEALPTLIGYPMSRDTRILVSAMFAPLPAESFGEAYLHVTLHYTPREGYGLVAPRSVFPFYLDVMGPVGEKEFPLPPGTHGMSWEGSPAVDGRILGIGGHMHDFADWIRLEDVTDGKIIWEAKPEVDANGSTIGVPASMLWWRGGVRVRTDHVYRISVQYSNPLDHPAPDGGMGAIGGVILSQSGVWPDFSRSNPDYIADLRNTLDKPRQAGGHAGHSAHGMPGN